jgi:hypothetical protein
VDDTAANCNRELRTAFLSRLRLSLGQPFWTDFGYHLDSLSEPTSAIAWTAFLSQLRLLLGQPFWTNFGYRLKSLSEPTSAIAWTAFRNKLRLSLGQPFWADFGYLLGTLSVQDFSCRLAVVLSVSVQNSQNTTLFWHFQFNWEKLDFRKALKNSNNCEFGCIPCDATRILRKSDGTS